MYSGLRKWHNLKYVHTGKSGYSKHDKEKEEWNIERIGNGEGNIWKWSWHPIEVVSRAHVHMNAYD